MKYLLSLPRPSAGRRVTSFLLACHIAAGVAVSVPLSRPAFAQGATSTYASVSLPRGAERSGDRKLSAGMGRLLGTETAKYFDLPAQEGDAEVYIWSGANFKPGRFRFLRTQVEEALTSAGYTYREIPDYENMPNAFQVEWDLEAINVVPVDGRQTYFMATNAKKQITVVGVWFNQESQKRVVLGLARTGFGGVEKGPTVLPDVTGPDTILVKDLNNAMKGVPAPPLPAFPKMAARPKTVRGMVRDGGGRPIAGAKIIVHASAAGGFRTSVTGRTNAQGIYEIPLPVGICQVVNADCQVTFLDQTYRLPLHPADGDLENFPSQAGHVENFVLRTYGTTATDSSGNYGGTLRLISQSFIKGGFVEVTLTPDGPMLDGSKGKTLVFRVPSSESQAGSEHFFQGIPLGRYTMKARLYDGEDVLPMRIQNTFGESAPSTAFTVVFEGNPGDIASLNQSGVKRLELTVKP